MKTLMKILRLSAGKIEDNGMLYANAIILDDSVSAVMETDRIDVGQMNAKVRISTDGNNDLARRLANSGLIPGDVTVVVKTGVRRGDATLEIVDFEVPK